MHPEIRPPAQDDPETIGIVLPRAGVAKWMGLGVALGLVLMALDWSWPPAAPRRFGAGVALVLLGLAGLFGTRVVRISRQQISLIYAVGRLPVFRSSIALSCITRVAPENEGRSPLIRIYGRSDELLTLDGFPSAELRDQLLTVVNTRLGERGTTLPA